MFYQESISKKDKKNFWWGGGAGGEGMGRWDVGKGARVSNFLLRIQI